MSENGTRWEEADVRGVVPALQARFPTFDPVDVARTPHAGILYVTFRAAPASVLEVCEVCRAAGCHVSAVAHAGELLYRFGISAGQDEFFLDRLEGLAGPAEPGPVRYDPTTLTGFQKTTIANRAYPASEPPVVFPALGLVGETGEVAEQVLQAVVPARPRTDDPALLWEVYFVLTAAASVGRRADDLKKRLRAGDLTDRDRAAVAELRARWAAAPAAVKAALLEEQADTLFYECQLAADQGAALGDLGAALHAKQRRRRETEDGRG